ncbi:hypothetical protein Bbelb_363390 [Branchiostoma belcheri]|nr:hypothetical protein Bbelb_363390 [Branchiostoma belcheri]
MDEKAGVRSSVRRGSVRRMISLPDCHTLFSPLYIPAMTGDYPADTCTSHVISPAGNQRTLAGCITDFCRSHRTQPSHPRVLVKFVGTSPGHSPSLFWQLRRRPEIIPAPPFRARVYIEGGKSQPTTQDVVMVEKVSNTSLMSHIKTRQKNSSVPADYDFGANPNTAPTLAEIGKVPKRYV